VIRILAWGAFGGAIGALAWLLLTGDTSVLGWVLGLGIPALTMLLILLPVASGLSGLSGLVRPVLTPAEVEAAQREGRVAVARVDSIAETGTRINEAPVCNVQLTVVPTRGTPYSTTAKEIVQVIQAPQVQPGARPVVVQTDLETGAVRLWWGASPEWREKAAADPYLARNEVPPPYVRLDAATPRASTVGTSSLTTPGMTSSSVTTPGLTTPGLTTPGLTTPTVSVTPGAPAPKKRRTGLRKIPAIVFVLAVVIGAGATSWPHRQAYRAMLDRTTPLSEVRAYYSPEAAAARRSAQWQAELDQREAESARQEAAEEAEHAATLAEVSPHVGTNAQQALAKLADATGSAVFASVYISYETISVEAANPPGSETFDDWYYRAAEGSVEHDGPTLIQPDRDELDLTLIDVRDYDLTVIPAIIAKARKKSGLTDADPSDVGVSLQTETIWTDDGGKRRGRPTYSVSVRNDYYDAYFTFSGTGKLLDMSGGTPDSESGKADKNS